MELSFSSITPGRGRRCPLAGPLHRGRVKTPQWNPCLLSIGRPKNFVQLSSRRSGYWKRKDAHFKVLCGQMDERGVVHVVEGSCIDEIYDALAKRLLPTATTTSNSNYKYLVALAGPPGAGKSTLAHEVVSRINKSWPEKSTSLDSQVKPSDVATVVPMDGFHLYRSELDAMEDPQEAHARRGAPWTFNPSRLLACLKSLRSQGSVYAPSFDHGIGDPVEDDIFVNLQHKVVIVEGNYLLLEDGIWKELSSLFDEKW
ncbi:putative uridine kinase C227.14 isoform X2 [Neltuma alba]|nr:putative uridine kinase C227.14 isoform X2 [Prosopis alba]